MSSLKTFKKGDVLFKEGDKAGSVFLLQSGAVSICLARPKRNIELFLVASPNVIGEQALQGAATHAVTAIATVETKVVEVPIEMFRSQVATVPQAVQVVLKGLGDRIKALVAEIKSARLERDAAPVPEDQVARALGVAFHAASYKGKKEGDVLVVNWTGARQHAQRIFGESPKRFDQIMSILVKLKMAAYEYSQEEKDAEGADAISALRVSDLSSLEMAADYYQHYYFKGGKADLLKTEEGPFQFVTGLVACFDGEPVDRLGMAKIEYGKLLERLKSEVGLHVKNDHWERLEAKGLFARRQQTDGGVFVQLEVAEFRRILQTWKILREIEKLNERGFVDMTEALDGKKAKADGAAACPSCQTEIVGMQKFCGNCGHKLAAAA